MAENEQPDPRLHQAAISDRDARPWRYYRLDYEDLRRGLDVRQDRIETLLVALKALLAAHVYADGEGLVPVSLAEEAEAARAAIAKADGRQMDRDELTSLQAILRERVRPLMRDVEGDAIRVIDMRLGELRGIPRWQTTS